MIFGLFALGGIAIVSGLQSARERSTREQVAESDWQEELIEIFDASCAAGAQTEIEGLEARLELARQDGTPAFTVAVIEASLEMTRELATQQRSPEVDKLYVRLRNETLAKGRRQSHLKGSEWAAAIRRILLELRSKAEVEMDAIILERAKAKLGQS